MKSLHTCSLRDWLATQPQTTDLGLYIHVPFCRQRCHFCAFYLHIHQDHLVHRFLSALEEEIQFYADTARLCQRPISTIYFGGGTPTSLHVDQLSSILAMIQQRFHLQSDTEITVEASPDTITQSYLTQLRELGVNRISFGAQSFEDSEWCRLGRVGQVGTAFDAVHLAQVAGFKNVNLDLMYALPGQTLESWAKSLHQARLLNPTHISCYALTIEEGTRFHVDRLRGDLQQTDPELENQMMDLAVSVLEDGQYQRYEISNFCKDGYECRHNLRYWKGGNYLGFGPSAQSYVDGVRFGNVEDLNRYAWALSKKDLPLANLEFLSKNQIDRERVVFGLRLLSGLQLSDVRELTQDMSWVASVDHLIQERILIKETNWLYLTKMGRRFLDAVSVALM